MESTENVVNIQITIDTDGIMSDFSPNPSPNPNNPVGTNHRYSYMVATSANVFSAQTEGTADLEIQANVGDYINWHITSEYGNVKNPVIMTDIFKYSGTNVFNNITPTSVTENTVVMDSESQVSLQNQTFSFFSAHIENAGTEGYGVVFALYYVDNDEYKIYDYYKWDPTIIIEEIGLG